MGELATLAIARLHLVELTVVPPVHPHENSIFNVGFFVILLSDEASAA